MHRFKDPLVGSVFAAYPASTRVKLLSLRELIFRTASRTTGVGPVEEVLKWGQPSYVTAVSRSGSTIRIGLAAPGSADYALFFHCQTSLIDSFKRRFGPTFRYAGNRALVFSVADKLPRSKVSECVADALTYHLKKEKKQRVAIGLLIR